MNEKPFLSSCPKDFEFNLKVEKFTLGPGQYLPISRENKNSNGVSSAFNSKVKRMFERTRATTPGPGSYYHDSQKDKNKNLKENEKTLEVIKLGILGPEGLETSYVKPKRKNKLIMEYNSKYRLTTEEIAQLMNSNVEYDPKVVQFLQAVQKRNNNYEKLGFTFREKRFKETNEDQVPGPGKYIATNQFRSQSRATTARCIRNKERIKRVEEGVVKDMYGSCNAIPQKNTYGYNYNQIGQLEKNINPDEFKSFSGVGYDTVGPGSYEVILPEQWTNYGTRWAKSFVVRNQFKTKKEIKKEMERLKKENLKVEMKQGTKIKMEGLTNRTIYHQVNKKKKFDEKLHEYDLVGELHYAPVEMNHYMKRKENAAVIYPDRVENMLKLTNDQKLFPGPGTYYNEDVHSSFKKAATIKECKKKFYAGGSAFGSSLKRFNFNPEEQKIGPGSYFLNKKNFQKKIKYIPNLKREYPVSVSVDENSLKLF
ncbi:MAG: hypothetical protein MJ252_02840 [archaeon]|nr:hypothetical protein [archaeon]